MPSSAPSSALPCMYVSSLQFGVCMSVCCMYVVCMYVSAIWCMYVSSLQSAGATHRPRPHPFPLLLPRQAVLGPTRSQQQPPWQHQISAGHRPQHFHPWRCVEVWFFCSLLGSIKFHSGSGHPQRCNDLINCSSPPGSIKFQPGSGRSTFVVIVVRCMLNDKALPACFAYTEGL